MDFLPLPENVASHVPVPDLGGPGYDHSGFIGFDQRQGWNVNALRQGRLNAARKDWKAYERLWSNTVLPIDNPHQDESHIRTVMSRIASAKKQRRRLMLAAAFIQTWILYGILQEVLKRPVLRHEISSNTTKEAALKMAPGRYLTLRFVFSEFLAKRRSWKEDPAASAQSVACLREAAMVLSNFVHLRIFPTQSRLLQSVFFALAALVEEIYMSLLAFCHSVSQDVPVFVRQVYFGQRLQEQCNWCPNLVRRMYQLRVAGLYYASLVPGLTAHSRRDHDSCGRDLCVAYNTDKNDYTVLHVQEHCACSDAACAHKSADCPCDDVAMPKDDFREAFTDECFPLVRLEGDAINITKYEAGMNFIAISHPWSDGRGNPFANALPLCQLREIMHYVTSALPRSQPSPLFWMDTLCVPLEEPLRNTAVMRMAKVYSSATKVLVLSAELTAAKIPSKNWPWDATETLVRIFCSKWSTRLWLMQEAALAKTLVFQFSDTAAMLDTLDAYRNVALREPTDQSFLLISAAWGRVNSLAGMNELYGGSRTCSLEELWSGLRHRTSSRLSDAAICCSILMGSNLSRVLAAPDDEKIQTFWACQETVPPTILFIYGPHLKIDGFRWAPSDLLHPQSLIGAALPVRLTSGNGIQPEAKVSPDGLLVRGLKAVVVKFPQRQRSRLHIYRFSLPGVNRRYYFMLGGHRDQSWDTFVQDPASHWDGTCVLLLSTGLYHSSDVLDGAAVTVPSQMSPPPPPPPLPLNRNVVAEEVGHAAQCIRTRYVIHVAVWHEDEAETRIAFADIGRTSNTWVANLGRRHVTDLGQVAIIDASQRWCVY